MDHNWSPTPPAPGRAPTRPDDPDGRPVIAIVGAGFSGTLLALHCLRRCPPATRIVLIERAARFGHGQAYATGNASHLLNVPAGKMSAFQDHPNDFLDWLQHRPDLSQTDLSQPDPTQADPNQSPSTRTAPSTAACFVPRRVYGAYVRHLLKQELRRPEIAGRLLLVRDDVLGLSPAGARLSLRLARHPERAADLVVLATGSLPPSPPPLPAQPDEPSVFDSPFYRPDPWAADALTDLPPDAGVLLIGTGLTMVDLVSSLLDQGHAGPIHALSRRGLLPERHAPAPAIREPTSLAYPTAPAALLRLLRAEAARLAARGGNWRSVVDDMRPFTHDIWQAMAPAERQRFMRHGRRWWDVHRHRMAPTVAERIAAAQRHGQLRVKAGRLSQLRRHDDHVSATYATACGGTTTLHIARVINCAGPGADYARIAAPLLQDLLRHGIARPDPLQLGLDVSATGALISRDGAISRRLFAVGPPTRGRFWEMTAVPDIRRQCELLAATLAGLIKV